MAWPVTLAAGAVVTTAHYNSVVTALNTAQGTYNANGQTIANIGATTFTGAATFTSASFSGTTTFNATSTHSATSVFNAAVSVTAALSLTSTLSTSGTIPANQQGVTVNSTVSSTGSNPTIGVVVAPKETSVSAGGLFIGTQFEVVLAGAFTEPDAVAAYVNSPQISAGAAITTAVGLQISSQKVTGVALGYGIYQSSSADINYFAGRIGIGTTAPTVPLHIHQVVSGGVGPIIVLDNSNGVLHDAAAIRMVDGSLRGELRFSVDSSPFGADLIYLGGASGTTEVFRVMSAGNVGIGTSNPTSMLQVIGLPTYSSDSAAGTGGLTTGAFYKDSGGGLHVKL